MTLSAGLLLSYVSALADPGAMLLDVRFPEGSPGHATPEGWPGEILAGVVVLTALVGVVLTSLTRASTEISTGSDPGGDR